jgi:hypothetical protein
MTMNQQAERTLSSMSDVIWAHRAYSRTKCHCGWCLLPGVFHGGVVQAGIEHAIHVAQELAKAGYGGMRDAWDEGHRTYVDRELSGRLCGAHDTSEYEASALFWEVAAKQVTINVPGNCVVEYGNSVTECFSRPGTYTYTPDPSKTLTIRTLS